MHPTDSRADSMPTPTFPVYGLGETFTGPRSMHGWQLLLGQHGPLWWVALLHGALDGAHVLVVSVAKLPPHDLGPHHRIVATGIDDAAHHALLHSETVERRRRPGSPRAEYAPILGADGDLGSIGWVEREASVDGRARALWFTSPWGHSWAAAADLGPVALGVSGDGIDLEEHEFIELRELRPT